MLVDLKLADYMTWIMIFLKNMIITCENLQIWRLTDRDLEILIDQSI
jgi:hypothetical protein